MNYYNEIKNELIDNEINKRVKDYSKSKYELQKYYNVGKLLFDAGKHYGEGIIKEYFIKLVREVDKKYNERTLRRMRQFYGKFSDEKWSTMSTKLTCIKYNINVRELREKIKSKEYERLSQKTKDKLISEEILIMIKQ